MNPLLVIILFSIGDIIRKSTKPKQAYLCKDMPDDVLEVISLQDQEVFSVLYRTCSTLRLRLKKLIPQAMILFSIPDIERPGIRIYPNGRRYGVHIRRANLITTVEYRCDYDWTIRFDHIPKYLDYKTRDEYWVWDTRSEVYTYIRIHTLTDDIEYKFDGFNWRYIKDRIYIGHDLPTKYRELSVIRYNVAKELLAQYCREINI